MPDRHVFTKLVDEAGMAARITEYQQRTGAPWPQAATFSWVIRDVTAGRDVTGGRAGTLEEADRQATLALQVVEEVDADRYAAELGGW